jgi:uncharacterized protein DUF1329
MRARILRIAALCVAVLATPPHVLAEVPPVGTVVNKDNAEKYAEVLNPTQQYMLKHGATMPVTEYRKYEWQPAYKEATEKYASQVRLSPDGRDIVNYVAGAPFPIIDENDPQAGAKWMWNHEQGPKYTDNVGVGWNVELVNDRGERERFFGSNFWRRMMWRGRLVLDPKPVVPHDPAIGYTEQWGPLHDPHDLKGSGALNFRYVSPDVPDDTYFYVPELRKVRRISVANRSDAFWGTDIDIDAIWTWNSKLSFWTFKYLGTHRLLAAFHSGGYAQREAWCAQPDGTSGIKAFFCCVNHELRDTVIVEGTPSGFSQYAFSKRILYIDKESLMAQFNEGYDQGGQLWKSWYMYSDAGKSPHDIERQPDGSIKVIPTKTVNPPSYAHERLSASHGGVVDMQLNHASKWDAPDGYLYPNPGVGHGYVDEPRDWNTPDNFTINYLIKSAGF